MPAKKRTIPKRKNPPIKSHGKGRRRESHINELVSKYSPNPQGVKKMALEIFSYLTPAQTRKEFQEAYNTWSVEKILKGKRIPVLFSLGSTGKMRPKWGCYTGCRVMFSALQKMGLKPRMARYFLDGRGPLKVQRLIKNPSSKRPHTSIFFEYNGQLYNVDPFFPKLPVHKVGDKEMEILRELQKNERFFFVKPGQIPFEEFEEEQQRGKIKPRKPEPTKD